MPNEVDARILQDIQNLNHYDPIQGWLRDGMWLIGRIDKRFYQVRSVVGGVVSLSGPDYSDELSHCNHFDLIANFYSPTYFECDSCRRKPGSPTLCSKCLSRRADYSRDGFCELPNACPDPYWGGYISVEEPEALVKFRRVRFEHEEPL